MSAVTRYLSMAFLIIAISFAAIVFNTVNAEYEDANGRPIVDYSVTPYLNYTDLYAVDTTGDSLNETTRDIADFNKPEDIGFDFAFWQSIKIAKILGNTFVYTLYGFPTFLLNFGMPKVLLAPLIIFIGLGAVFFMIYTIIGKNY